MIRLLREARGSSHDMTKHDITGCSAVQIKGWDGMALLFG
jgi:hypothetical protein